MVSVLTATVLGVAGTPLLAAVAPPAGAVDVPTGDFTQAFSIQTNGRNGAITLGDYYSATTAQGGAQQAHRLTLHVPCSWPADLPISVDLFSPQINTATTGYPGNQTYEEPAGAGDTTTYTLNGPTGTQLATTTYQPINSTTDTWSRFATLAAPVTCGTYSLLDTTSNDDQNGWKVRFGYDDDANPNNTPPVNSDNPDGVPGTDDELTVGLQQISYQHDLGNGTPARAKCLTLHQYVGPGRPSITFNNFDMDSTTMAGSGVRYYAPSATYDPLGQSGGIVGTLSGNGTWNRVGGGGTTTRSGDTIANPEPGWWKLVTCIDNHNQFIQEGIAGQPVYLTQPPTPVLQLSKTDGETVVDPGQRVSYTLTATNAAVGSTAGAATNVVVKDTLPTGMTPVSCTVTAATAGETCSFVGQVATATLASPIPANGGTRTITVTADVVTTGAPATFVNSATATYADSIGNAHAPVDATDTDTRSAADLAITKAHTGSFMIGTTGTYSLGVTNVAGSTSRARGVTVVDTLPPGLQFVSSTGAGWSCTVTGQVVSCLYAPDLAVGASTTLSLSVNVLSAAYPSMTNSATVSSNTVDPVPGNNTATDPTTVVGASIGDTVYVDSNANGAQDGGEVGLDGVTVTLLDSVGAQIGSPTVTATVGGVPGRYSFTGLTAGTYTVTATVPSGSYATTPIAVTRTLTPGGAVTDADVGLARYGSIGDLVFDDTDGDGSAAGESGLAGATITVTGPGSSSTTSAATDATGAYLLDGLVAGTYTVTVTLPGGFVATTVTSYTTTLQPGQAVTTDDFGARRSPSPGTNTSPSFTGDSTNAAQTVPVGGGLVPLTATDPDGDPRTFTVTGGTLPPGVTLNPDGTFGGAATAPGTTTVTVGVSDGRGGSATTTLVVTVTAPANRAPAAVDDTATVTAGSSVDTPVLANDTDPDNDPLSLTSVTQPAHGTVVCDTTITPGRPAVTCTYTPTAGYTGADSYDYVVSDGPGLSDIGTVTVTVTPAPNRPPVFDPTTNNTTQTVVVGGTPGPLTASDPDADPLVFTVTAGTLPPGLTLNPDGTFSGTATTAGGPTTVTITVTDGRGDDSTTLAVTVTVAAVGGPPVAVNDTATTATGTPVTTQVLANDTDPDNDPLVVAGHGTPAHGTVTCTATACTYTPAPSYAGPDSYAYTISDGTGSTATATVTVTVSNAVPAFDGTAGNTSQTIPVGAQPTPVHAVDPNGDPLTYVVTGGSLPPGITLSPDGTFAGPATTPGTTTVTITATDGQGGTVSTTLAITVVPPSNRQPVATDDTATSAGAPTTIPVLRNDTDPDGDPLTVLSSTAPGKGTVTCNATACTYTPAPAANGTDTFTYTVGDGKGGTSTATVTVVLTPVNDPPVARPDRATTTSGVPTTLSVLGNDTDPDGDALTVVAASTPGHGTVTCSATGVCVYTPDAGFAGNDSFTYTVSDGNGGTAIGRVDVVVTNRAPVLRPDPTTVTSGTTTTITVLGNDSDPDGDPLTILRHSDPEQGTVVCTGMTCTYTPDAGFAGTDSFTYTVTDGFGHTVTTTVPITVAAAAVVGGGGTGGSGSGGTGSGGSGSGGVSGGGGLPFTGDSLGAQAGWAVGLVGLGLLLLLAGRRPRRTCPPLG